MGIKIAVNAYIVNKMRFPHQPVDFFFKKVLHLSNLALVKDALKFIQHHDGSGGNIADGRLFQIVFQLFLCTRKLCAALLNKLNLGCCLLLQLYLFRQQLALFLKKLRTLAHILLYRRHIAVIQFSPGPGR